MQSPIIRLQNISKTFNKGKNNEVIAVKNISLEILPHTCTVIQGASGSGKSTLLSIIACLNKASSGDYWLMGNHVTHWSEKFLTQFRRKHIGIVFQNFQLIPDLTVFQNIALPLLPFPYSYKEIEQKVKPWAEQLGIAHRLLFQVKNLSGGEMQRTALARALVQNPSILIADEPTSHLDTQRSVQILQILNELKHNGKTILLATHDLRVREHLQIDNCLQMKDGELI
ncbi:MAG: ABC transporter ATP-binding protein [Microscillaceae bacterium]|nr:ABC transporter ATP-binding protein [Microscillaceae bacterium]MDW8459636.1 ABC transporter ATP-binding protein [Cytophagales bacterium]